MFASRLMLLGVVLLVGVSVALGAARPSGGAAPETRYLVLPGDTVWEIAMERYGGDVRAAVWRIEERNGLRDGESLQPGQVLVMPP